MVPKRKEKDEEIEMEDEEMEEGIPRRKRRKMVVPQSDLANLLSVPESFLAKTRRKVRPGSIARISMHNLMVYEDTTVFPGPGLNVILGPNGSGKSTIAAALCLGLGGSPKVLNQVTGLRSFVNRDTFESKAFVEIELAGESENTVVRRTIDRQKNTSTWKIGGKSCSETSVLDFVMNHNIDVTNMCQFLPQQQVQQFVMASPQELLKLTEKATGHEDWIQVHNSLITKQSRVNQHQDEQVVLQEQIERIRTENLEVEQDVIRFQQRAKYTKEIEDMKSYRVWLEYKLKTEDFEKLKEERDAALEVVKAETVKTSPLQNEIIELGNVVQREKIKRDKHEKELNECVREYKKIVKGFEKIDEHIETQDQEIAELKTEFKDQQKTRVKAEQKVKKMEENLAKVSASVNVPEVDARIAEITRRFKELSRMRRSNDEEIANLKNELKTINSQLNIIGNEKTRKLNIMLGFERSDDLKKAIYLVDQMKNGGAFRGEVYGPIALEVSVTDASFANFVEESIPQYVLKSFVCAHASDYDLLLENFRTKKIHITVFSPNSHAQRRRYVELNSVRHLGITHYLDEVIKCPDSVHSTLCDVSNIHAVVVGNIDADKNRDAIFKLSGNPIRNLFTPVSHCTFRPARYGGVGSAQISNVKKAKIIGVSQDSSRINQLENKRAQTNKRIHDLKSQESQYTKQQTDATNEVQALKKEKRALTHANSMLSTAKMELEDTISEYISEEEYNRSITDMQNQLGEFHADKANHFFEVRDNQKNQYRFATLQGIAAIEYARTSSIWRSKKFELKESQRMLTQSQMAYEQLKEQVVECRQQARQIRDNAVRTTGTDGPSEELQEMAEGFPQTLGELDARVEDFNQKARAIYVHNPNAIAEYEKRVNDLKAQEARKEQVSQGIDTLKAEVEALRGPWLTELRIVIETMSEKFGQLMRNIGNAGEIQLDEPGLDFQKYGIKIMVKFEKSEIAPLQQLRPDHQSSGEKNVSTMLYLLSLQVLSPAPFRLLDEIDHGMDESNRRKTFNALRRNCGEDKPQYFYISPHCLPDLEYDRNTSVLTVTSGRFMNVTGTSIFRDLALVHHSIIK